MFYLDALCNWASKTNAAASVSERWMQSVSWIHSRRKYSKMYELIHSVHNWKVKGRKKFLVPSVQVPDFDDKPFQP